MSLSPELRQRILEEERFRVEARLRASEEVRLRRQTVTTALRLVLMVGLFAGAYVVSHTYLSRGQSIPEAAVSPPASPLVAQVVLDDVARVLAPDAPAEVCARAVGRSQPQIKATIMLERDISRQAARGLAMEKAREVGAALRGHGLALPAYVEIFSPGRWYGMAVYDRDTLRISWDPCPGRCEQEGTAYVRRCAVEPAPTAAPPAAPRP